MAVFQGRRLKGSDESAMTGGHGRCSSPAAQQPPTESTEKKSLEKNIILNQLLEKITGKNNWKKYQLEKIFFSHGFVGGNAMVLLLLFFACAAVPVSVSVFVLCRCKSQVFVW